MTVDNDEKMAGTPANTATHETSLAVWDISSPIISGRPANLKVGVRCSGGCPLSQREIQILDAAQKTIAVARLAAAPWPGTSGLYWAEVSFPSPVSEGTHLWTARFSSSHLEIPHLSSSLPFSLMTVKQPEFRVTVEVVEQNTNTAVDNSEVRMGPFRTLTNANGVAVLEVPRGTHELNAWKLGYEFTTHNVDVNEDVSLTVELVVEPEPSPYI